MVAFGFAEEEFDETALLGGRVDLAVEPEEGLDGFYPGEGLIQRKMVQLGVVAGGTVEGRFAALRATAFVSPEKATMAFDRVLPGSRVLKLARLHEDSCGVGGTADFCKADKSHRGLCHADVRFQMD